MNQVPVRQTSNLPVRAYALEERSPHNRVVTLLLFLFFGLIGVHRFYVGKTGSGLAMLMLSIFSFGAIGMIWWVVDLLLIATGRFTDSEGRVLGPPQITHEPPHARQQRPRQQLPTYEPELEPVRGSDGGDWDAELMRDPLEDKFADLERELNQR